MLTLEQKRNDLKAAFTKCVEAPGPYSSEREKEICRRLVQKLPGDLARHAANTSYAYWYLSQEPESCPSEEIKISMAMREARRHLSYMAGDYSKAFANLVEGCHYRKVSVAMMICRSVCLLFLCIELLMIDF